MEETGSLQVGSAILVFLSGWHTVQHGSIRPGGQLVIVYEPERLPHCRLRHRGADFFSIVVHVRFHPGGQRDAGSLLEDFWNQYGDIGKRPAAFDVLVPLDAQEVEMWFHNWHYDYRSDYRRCDAWDSRYGQNYHFPVIRE